MDAFPNNYLPGALSLFDQLDKKLLVVLRDGKMLIGYLRTIDQFANMVLQDCVERIIVDKAYGDIPRGIYVLRGENVVLAGEMDERSEAEQKLLKQVTVEEIIQLQKEQLECKQRLALVQAKARQERGLPPRVDLMGED